MATRPPAFKSKRQADRTRPLLKDEIGILGGDADAPSQTARRVFFVGSHRPDGYTFCMAIDRSRSPFPGMDPYLEQYWGDVHHALCTCSRDLLRRSLPPGLIARILTGGLSAAAIAAAGGQNWWIGATLGGVAGVIGAFGGYQIRTRLVRALRVPDFVIAALEDLVAIGGGLFLVSRF